MLNLYWENVKCTTILRFIEKHWVPTPSILCNTKNCWNVGQGHCCFKSLNSNCGDVAL